MALNLQQGLTTEIISYQWERVIAMDVFLSISAPDKRAPHILFGSISFPLLILLGFP